ncbi:endonuclease/exonuclease/phosphatase family protein [Aeromicrobium choanae]|uniref:Endonuclease/Exonuclease/phosphatase family protein n=1 Tax=Aeromicrobium choanae TaxID=1736691 RepID=A0A1T4Z408_9ACTN|nr:endonuclease/exonuclease/phosphatase family protein [Aeromicrobium choanae]SKB08787.1 Endonuclease/Exonuclease/phosphatase family protein [Aeromicrobium choanae]
MRSRLAAASLALAVATGLLAVPLTAGPASAAPARCAAYGDVVRETSAGGVLAGRTPLLVASYNIAGYNASAGTMPRWESRADRIVDKIMRCAPDVIGLQEASEAWMQRRPAGSRNHAQYEHVVDLMNARTAGAPYRVTNTNRKQCPTTGPNPAVWNGTWKGQRAPWRACTTSPSASSSDNRTVYDSRVLEVVRHGSRALSSATSTKRTLDWTVFRVRATGRQFVFANTHLDARYRGRAITTSASNSFRRKQAAQVLATVKQLRAGTPAAVLVGDMNSNGRTRSTTAVDDFTRAGLFDLLGTDRRKYKSKSARWRGSCKSVGVTSSLTNTRKWRVPLHVKRRINVSYNSSNAVSGKGPGSAKNTCMYRDKKLKRPRGSTPGAYYRQQGTRIDYVLAAGFRGRGWETVVDANLRKARYRVTPPSDHNMVAATLAF